MVAKVSVEHFTVHGTLLEGRLTLNCLQSKENHLGVLLDGSCNPTVDLRAAPTALLIRKPIAGHGP